MSTTGNVDAQEIDRFDTLAAEWWDPHGSSAPLHRINPLRLDYIERQCGGLEGLEVLDVGCGGGLLSEAMAGRGARVTGIDLAPRALAVAREHARQSDLEIDYREIAAETLAAQQPASFDLVTCLEMLEHVPDPAAVIRACGQLVRPGGRVIFSTINRTPRAWALAIVAAEQLLGMVPRGTHSYERLLRPSELATPAREVGLEITDLTGLHYNPLMDVFKLGPGIEVNYFMSCRRACQ